MEDFKKQSSDFFGERYDDVKEALIDSGMKLNRANFEKLATMALASSIVLQTSKDIAECSVLDLSDNIKKLQDKVKKYEKLMFHLKLEKED